MGDPSATGDPAPASVNPSTAPGGQGPCPGQGYVCDDCLDGWFCPPTQTPAQPAPCGYGWPCYHCAHGWFCAPQQTTVTLCPLSQTTAASAGVATPSSQQPAGPTASLTTFVTSSPSFHPATGGWSYAGCYRDDANRSLKNYSVVAPAASDMTNDKCITLCRDNNFSIAGTEYGSQCFCGNVLVDSILLDDSRCNMTCDGGSGRFCGGIWALSLWSADGKVLQVASPEHQFTLPRPSPGSPGVAVHPGGIMMTVVPVTTALDMWPPPVPSTIGSLSAAGLSTMSSSPTGGRLSTSSTYNDDTVPQVKDVRSGTLSEAQLADRAETLRVNQAASKVQTLVRHDRIWHDLLVFAGDLYSGPTSFAESLRTGSKTPRPSAHGGFTGSGHGLATPTPPADGAFASSMTLPDTSTNLAVTTQSPTEFGPSRSYAGRAVMSTPRLRYRGFVGRYRDAMPFIA